MSKNYGCNKSRKDIRDYKIKSSKLEFKFPIFFELSDLPRVKNQLDVKSCVAHATSSILEYYANNNVDLSTDFLYGSEQILFNEHNEGMCIRNACEIVLKYGDVLEDDCKGNHEVPLCGENAAACYNNQTVMDRAKLFGVSSYYYCKSIEDIKYAIYNYGPVLAGVYWRNNYKFKKDGKTIVFDNKEDGGYHAIMIYGWDEIGFLCQNSYGNTFGRHGRFTLPYSYSINEAVVFVDIDNDAEISALVKPKISKLTLLCKIINYILNAIS